MTNRTNPTQDEMRQKLELALLIEATPTSIYALEIQDSADEEGEWLAFDKDSIVQILTELIEAHTQQAVRGAERQGKLSALNAVLYLNFKNPDVKQLIQNYYDSVKNESEEHNAPALQEDKQP